MTTPARTLREKRGVTQREVANAVGVTERTLQTIESSSDYSPSGRVIKALADFYCVSTDVILGRDTGGGAS